jgi:hypothetical protein
MNANFAQPSPFALSLSKGSSRELRGFDKLSPNGNGAMGIKLNGIPR